MPLLVCPNDNTAMQSVARSGVEFDFCPSCRGIWLDRGELEKLMAAARDQELPRDREGSRDQEEHGRSPEPPRYSRPEPSAGDRRWGDRDDHRDRDHRGDRDYRDRRGDDDDHRNRRRRGFDIFDIFD